MALSGVNAGPSGRDLHARWTRCDASAHRLHLEARPVRLDPPGRAGVAPGADHGRRGDGVVGRGRSLDHDVESLDAAPAADPAPHLGKQRWRELAARAVFAAQHVWEQAVRTTRLIDRSLGQAPTTQTGMRGRWTGVGRKAIGSKR